MGLLLKLLFGAGNQSGKGKRDKGLEREMDKYGLLEEEKELVRSGEYDPWNFEDEEADEDDYYHGDS